MMIKYTMLCPFHWKVMVKVGEKWVCPVPACHYQRVACPRCGYIIRILRSESFCLRCFKRFSDEEVVRLFSRAFNVSVERAKREVAIIMSRY